MKKFWKNITDNDKNSLVAIIRLFLFWQVIVLVVALISGRMIAPRLRFMYNDGPRMSNPKLLWPRANFDGVHYLEIARNGYGLYEQAFFPLYPNLIRLLAPVFGGKDLVAAVFISNLAMLGALWFFYKLTRIDYDSKSAFRSLIFYLVFPSSFFLGMVYTESLFLFFVLASFYSARKEKWFWAGIFGALASNTRIVGACLFPALIWEWWQQNKIKNLKLKIKNLFPLFLIPVGLLSYIQFLWKNYQDPLMFLHVQPFFGAERSAGKIILIYQVFWRYLKMIFTTKWDPLYFTVWSELLTAVGFLTLLFLVYKNGLRNSYLIFFVLAYLIPTLSGTFLSMPRFALSLFPGFIYLGTIKNKIISNFLIVAFAILWIVSIAFFLNGYWIA